MSKYRVNRKAKHSSQLRNQLVITAARIMYEEGVKQYFDAKRIAARRLLQQGGGRKMRVIDLPSNGEIADAVAKLAQLHEGDTRTKMLFAMRIIALDVMENLSEFTPRLIGSVSTGRVKSSSDIDIHIFTDEFDLLENRLNLLGWRYETDRVAIQKNGRIEEFIHVYIESHFPIELSVYPAHDIRVRGRSSTDGKPINRMKAQVLQKLICEEHNEQWISYLDTNEISGLPNSS